MSSAASGQSIGQLSVLIQSGWLDPVAVVEETLGAIRAYRDQSIFISLLEERALKEAAASSARIKAGRSLGLLDGVPVAWKDLFAIKGIATTAGSKLLARDAPADSDADVVAALAAAGMISIGRVNMSEFAYSGLGVNPHYGTPENPNSTDGHRLPGGSSSGSAAAVASGLVPVSIGTDTGGSVRIPAAFNGIVGYKASRGRYSMEGVYPLATSLDSLGPLCRTVKDAVWVDAAMRGRSAPEITTASLSGLSLAIPETVFFDGAEEGVIAAFERAVTDLVKVGVKVRRVAFPEIAEIFSLMERHGALVAAEAFVFHRERITGPDASEMDPRVVKRVRMGEKITLEDYIETLHARERLKASFSSRLMAGELLATPTLPHVAPHIAPLVEDDDAFFAMNGRTLRNTLVGNFLDWCGVSMPCGRGEANMPVGFLLSGQRWQDDQVLAAAMAVEPIIAA